MAGKDQEERTLMLGTLATMEGRFTELVSLLRGAIVNGVLTSETVKLDEQGVWSRDWTVPYGSVAVDNSNGTGDVTVVSDTPQGSAPAYGVGVHVIPVGGARVLCLVGRSLTIYG